MIHARIHPRSCAICYSTPQPNELVATVLNTTSSLQYSKLAKFSEDICSRLLCYRCKTGPYGFLFHVDCFNLLNVNQPPECKTLQPKTLWNMFSSKTGLAQLTNHESTKRARHAFETYFQSSDVHLDNIIKGLSKLPVEIRAEIAELSWPCSLHLAIVTLAEAPYLWDSIRQANNRQLTLSHEALYLNRTTLAGVSYVSDITYHNSHELIWKGGPITEMTITSDGFSVIGVSMKGHETTYPQPEQKYAQWYKSIAFLPDKPLDQITIYSKATVCDVNRAGESQPYWDSPKPPPLQLQSRYTSVVDKGLPLFMRYIELANDTAGISVACCTEGLVHMISHRRSLIPTTSTYAQIESVVAQDLVWSYFPMRQGEFLSGIWIRERFGSSYDRCPAVILQTSHGRHMTFGTSIQTYEQHLFEFHQVSCTPAHATGFCLNNLGVMGSSDFVFAVAHKSTFHANDESRPAMPANFIGIPKNYVTGSWFYSEACLLGVTELLLCIDLNQFYHPCIGILLKFNDGRMESLGQWRYDFAVTLVKLTTCFYICMRQVENRSYVQYIGLEKRESSEPGEVWQRVSAQDKVSWWWCTSGRSEVFVERL